MTFGNAQYKTPMFLCITEEFYRKTRSFQGNIYLKPEESPENTLFCIVYYMMLPYDLMKLFQLSCFSKANFSNSSSSIKGS